jgi:hypothetical protein
MYPYHHCIPKTTTNDDAGGAVYYVFLRSLGKRKTMMLVSGFCLVRQFPFLVYIWLTDSVCVIFSNDTKLCFAQKTKKKIGVDCK